MNAHYSGIWSAKARGNVSVSYGRELDYDLLVPAMGLRASLWGQWRPTTATRFDLSAGYQHLVPEGEPAETAASARLRATWQVRRQLGFRLISEYVTSNSGDEDSLDLSALVTWLKSPGTEAYLGATQALVMDGDVALLEQVYFFKISWLFRP